jgi:hypothetical protein
MIYNVAAKIEHMEFKIWEWTQVLRKGKQFLLLSGICNVTLVTNLVVSQIFLDAHGSKTSGLINNMWWDRISAITMKWDLFQRKKILQYLFLTD